MQEKRKAQVKIPEHSFLVNLNRDLLVAASSSCAHNNSDCLCDSALLTDNSAHIAFSYVKVINACVISINSNGDLIGIFYQALGNGKE